jgi:DNA polymerase III alpha subunit
MWTNKNSIDELIEGIVKNGPNNLDLCITDDDIQKYVDRVLEEHLDYPIPPKEINLKHWFIPHSYENMEIEEWLLGLCRNQTEIDRVTLELELYKQHNMMPVLTAMKYIVETLRQNKVVWGVGRGSSVASYVLYLIGVHKIDSIKYSIPIEEFFKGE